MWNIEKVFYWPRLLFPVFVRRITFLLFEEVLLLSVILNQLFTFQKFSRFIPLRPSPLRARPAARCGQPLSQVSAPFRGPGPPGGRWGYWPRHVRPITLSLGPPGSSRLPGGQGGRYLPLQSRPSNKGPRRKKVSPHLERQTRHPAWFGDTSGAVRDVSFTFRRGPG